MEEILASIRRIVAEEPMTPPQGVDLRPKSMSAFSEPGLDEPHDFDLPAIFRAPAPIPEKPALLGRLTDAIRSATTASPDKISAGDETAAEHAFALNGSPHHGAPLSTLKTPQRPELHAHDARAEEAHAGAQLNGSPHAAAAPQATTASSSSGWSFGRSVPPPPTEAEEVKRVMAPFMDTRFRQMSNVAEPASPAAPPSHEPAPVAVETPAHAATRPVDFGAIIPSRMDIAGAPATEHQRRPAGPVPESLSPPPPPRPDYAGLPPEHASVEIFAPMTPAPVAHGAADPAFGRPAGHFDEPHATPFRPAAPPAADAAPTGTIEDTTADLLRPMLRQWLADNMPRMVEKALHIEVAESVKTGRKFNGQ
jgi:cell pole-organizing protein PopZ